MRSLALLLLLSAISSAETVSFGTGDNQFEIEFVPIGNPGNPHDNSVEVCFNSCGEIIETGAVDYEYHIAKFEISRDMVEKANAAGGLNITLDSFDRFVDLPTPDMPATGIARGEALLFVNWLNTSLGAREAYKLPRNFWGSEVGGNRVRNQLARFALPTIDEWHKAAFYDPNKDGQGGYWDYATGSDEEPFPIPFGAVEGTAVFGQGAVSLPAEVHEAGGLSPYGVMGMSGNAAEWEETAWDLTEQPVFGFGATRDGYWSSPAFDSSMRIKRPLGTQSPLIGFRVVMLPVPDYDLGDFTLDGEIDEKDITKLSNAVFYGVEDFAYDINGDGEINQGDRLMLVEDIVGTQFGDVDLNGEVDFDDFLALSAGFDQYGHWKDGDINGDTTVNFDDFLILSANFGLKGGGVAAATVPEPASDVSIHGLLLCFAVFRRRRE